MAGSETWLYNIARGIDFEPVTPRLVSKSIGCCKQFRGKTALKTKSDVLHWIGELAGEIAERLEDDAHMNKRKAQQLTVSVQQIINNKKTPMSRSVPLHSYDAEAISDVAFTAVKRTSTAPSSSDLWSPPLLFLGISVGKFVDDTGTSSKTINQYFQNSTSSLSGIKNNCQTIESSVDDIKSVKPVQETFEVNNTKGTSFFERYFKTNKRLLNETNTGKMHIEHQEKNLASFDNNLKPSRPSDQPSTSGNNKYSDSMYCSSNYLENDKVDIFESTSVSNNSISNDNNDQSDNEDGMWVSPSEIFPDLNNIDENVMSMLPSPLQRKIISRAAKNDGVQENERNQNKVISCVKGDLKNNIVNSVDMFDTVTPTINDSSSPIVSSVKFVMTAEVHQCSDLYKNDEQLEKSDSLQEAVLSSNKPSKINNCSKTELIENNLKGDNFSQEHNKLLRHDPLKCSVKNSDLIDAIEVCVDGVGDDNLRSKTSEELSFKLCQYCNGSISVIEYQEHVDHHIAVELHEKLNSSQSTNIANSKINTNTASSIVLPKHIKNKSPHKRKKQSDKKLFNIKSKKSRSILSFFTPK